MKCRSLVKPRSQPLSNHEGLIFATFIKDLKELRGSPVYAAIYQLTFEEILNAERLTDIPNIKKLKGYNNAYRIRVGNYRVGFWVENETIQFSRVLHRREIYRYFP
ncbi:type II toxin-antitoxin system RelE family toxin [Alkalinema pantanalense CENA528]|uniref:type II toxin-antitoxin system RelE family toxin n=1 Tax=Alkalinema pantanalense TaxID=1620705 RepID=UPI003D6E91A5